MAHRIARTHRSSGSVWVMNEGRQGAGSVMYGSGSDLVCCPLWGHSHITSANLVSILDPLSVLYTFGAHQLCIFTQPPFLDHLLSHSCRGFHLWMVPFFYVTIFSSEQPNPHHPPLPLSPLPNCGHLRNRRRREGCKRIRQSTVVFAPVSAFWHFSDRSQRL